MNGLRASRCSNGLGWAGRALAFQIGHHRLADRWAHLGQPFDERDRTVRTGQLINNPEVEQYPLSVAHRRQIVLVALAGALVALVTSRSERLQIGSLSAFLHIANRSA